jgi:hypothetical protein
MRGALQGAVPSLVVDLRGGDVPVAEKILHFADVHADVEEKRCM